MVIASAGVRVGVRVVPSARGYRAMPCRAHATACHAVLANGEPGIVPCLAMACRAMHTMYHAVPRRAVPHVPHNNLPCTIMNCALQHMHRASCSSAVQCGQCAKYEGAIWATNCELTVHFLVPTTTTSHSCYLLSRYTGPLCGPAQYHYYLPCTWHAVRVCVRSIRTIA